MNTPYNKMRQTMLSQKVCLKSFRKGSLDDVMKLRT